MSTLNLFIMVDACGWEIVKDDPFLARLAPHRHRLESVFGYSSTCVPSIVSGRWPDEHRNWCYFVHDPEGSPFRFLRWLKWLPKAVTSRRIARRWLTRLAKKKLGFKGYFDLYNIPFAHIDQYDFTEKKSPLQPRGMNRGENIFDTLESQGIPYFVSDPAASEEGNLAALSDRIGKKDLDFAFLYCPGLDGLLHRVGNDSPEVPAKLRVYEQWIAQLHRLGLEHYDDVRLHVFSGDLRAHFDDGQFGELIFLVQEGVLIVPSHMGERPIRAMHGYHPHDPHSYATLFTNQATLPAEVTHIPHLHRLMEHAILS